MAKIKEDGTIEYSPEELTPPESVDYFIYSTSVAREHKHAENWKAACIVVFLIAVITNFYWIWRELQYEDIVITQNASTEDGGNAIVNGTASGDVNYYGESFADDQGQET